MEITIDSKWQCPDKIIKYRRDIDGIRAIAVTSVVLFHARFPWFTGGFSGVDIFFVISGFLIGGIIDRSIDAKDFSFRSFYARRCRRIIPALAGVLAFSFAAGMAILSPTEMKSFCNSAIFTIFGLSNIFFYHSINYFNPSAEYDPLLMTWSLGVEEQFYVFIPVILILISKHTPSWKMKFISLFIAISIAMSVYGINHRPSGAFYLLPTRAWELGLGLLLALANRVGWQVRNPIHVELLAAVGFIALLVSIIALNDKVAWPGYMALLPVGGTAALLMTSNSLINRKILSNGIMVGLGLISYSWYLYHWPLLVFLRIVSAGDPAPLASACVIVVSLLMGFLSWKFIETPFRKSSASSTETLYRYSVVVVIAVAVSFSGWWMDGYPERVSPAVAAAEAENTYFSNYPCLVRDQRANFAHTCNTGPSDTPDVAVIGDSHAAALGRGLALVGKARGHTVAVLTMSGCRPLWG